MIRVRETTGIVRLMVQYQLLPCLEQKIQYLICHILLINIAREHRLSVLDINCDIVLKQFNLSHYHPQEWKVVL